jgi:enoyl-CoA hydratase/carnithine racemase
MSEPGRQDDLTSKGDQAMPSLDHGAIGRPAPSSLKRFGTSGYFGRYRSVRLTRTADGVLIVRLHTDFGPFVFDPDACAELEDAFRCIARDRRNKVMILTGAGGDFIAGRERTVVALQPDGAFGGSPGVVSLLERLASVGAPVIAAIEGRAHAYPEIALMADVIVAGRGASLLRSEHASTPAEAEAVRGLWAARIGSLRADAFLAHTLPLSPERAKAWGLVDELSPTGGALARAIELARVYLRAPESTRRALRSCAIEPLREALSGAAWSDALARAEPAATVSEAA